MKIILGHDIVVQDMEGSYWKALKFLLFLPEQTSEMVLDLPIGITKLKDLQTHSRVQIPIATFHVEHSVPTFLPRRIASDRACK